jgi:hypothetical protein
VLLGLHHAAQAKRAKAPTKVTASPPSPPTPDAPAPGAQPTLGEIRDEIKRKAGTQV